MDKTVYICSGSCKAEISEEEYNKGLVKCGTKGCTHFGHTFKKVLKCRECGKYHLPGDGHTHLA